MLGGAHQHRARQDYHQRLRRLKRFRLTFGSPFSWALSTALIASPNKALSTSNGTTSGLAYEYSSTALLVFLRISWLDASWLSNRVVKATRAIMRRIAIACSSWDARLPPAASCNFNLAG